MNGIQLELCFQHTLLISTHRWIFLSTLLGNSLVERNLHLTMVRHTVVTNKRRILQELLQYGSKIWIP